MNIEHGTRNDEGEQTSLFYIRYRPDDLFFSGRLMIDECKRKVYSMKLAIADCNAAAY
jgi:hypothetical protein